MSAADLVTTTLARKFEAYPNLTPKLADIAAGRGATLDLPEIGQYVIGAIDALAQALMALAEHIDQTTGTDLDPNTGPAEQPG